MNEIIIFSYVVYVLAGTVNGNPYYDCPPPQSPAYTDPKACIDAAEEVGGMCVQIVGFSR